MLIAHACCVLSGDEFGHTRNGNNNWYGHDSKMTHFLWDQGQSASDLMEFTSGIVAFRKEHPALGQENFLKCVAKRSVECIWLFMFPHSIQKSPS